MKISTRKKERAINHNLFGAVAGVRSNWCHLWKLHPPPFTTMPRMTASLLGLIIALQLPGGHPPVQPVSGLITSSHRCLSSLFCVCARERQVQHLMCCNLMNIWCSIANASVYLKTQTEIEMNVVTEQCTAHWQMHSILRHDRCVCITFWVQQHTESHRSIKAIHLWGLFMMRGYECMRDHLKIWECVIDLP